MASLNKVQLLGHLGKDPETKTFDNGGSVTSFTLATQDSYFDKASNQRVALPTQWHNVRIGMPAIGKVAQTYLKKGSQVFIEGTINYRKYQDSTGADRFFTEISVTNMILIGSKASADGGPVQASAAQNGTFDPNTDNDLPF